MQICVINNKMSKTVKKKISVELPKAKLRESRDLSKSRLSVFQRLGTKKLKVAGSLVKLFYFYFSISIQIFVYIFQTKYFIIFFRLIRK